MYPICGITRNLLRRQNMLKISIFILFYCQTYKLATTPLLSYKNLKYTQQISKIVLPQISINTFHLPSKGYIQIKNHIKWDIISLLQTQSGRAKVVEYKGVLRRRMTRFVWTGATKRAKCTVRYRIDTHSTRKTKCPKFSP